MSSFEERLNRLEGQVNRHDALLSPHNNVLSTHTMAPMASSLHESADPGDPTSPQNIVLQEEPHGEMLTDGMAITFVSEDDSGFFGV